MAFSWPWKAGQQQRQRPQDKKPHEKEQSGPDFEEIEIESVDDVLEELEQLKKKEQQRCGCWGDS